MSDLVSAARSPASTARALWRRSHHAFGERRYTGDRLADLVIHVGLALVVIVTLGSVALLAIVHVDDRFEVNQAAGTWLALARDLREGMLYRPLFEDGYYGLAGYMPLQFVLHAGVSLVTNEYLVSAKLVAYASGGALVALVYALARSSGCPRLVSLGLVSAVLATQVGLVAVIGIHGDTLPLALELGALTLVARSRSRRVVAVAGVLCALALFTKFSAISIPLAIAVWLAVKHRDRLVLFMVTLVGGCVVLAGVFEAVSRGRLSENLTEVFVPGGSAGEGSALAGVATFFELMVDRAGAIWLLMPAAVLIVLAALARRSLSLVELAFLVSVPVTVVVLGNPGSDFNHLIDVGVLTVLVVAGAWARPVQRGAAPSPLAALIAIAVILGTAQSYRTYLQPETAHAFRVVRGVQSTAYPTNPLEGMIHDDQSFLSEDPVLPLLRGERPVLLDGIGLRRLGERHPEAIADLERRLDAHRFDRVVLINSVADRRWYEQISMGATIRDAIARNYVLLTRVPAPPHAYLWVYGPRRQASGTAG